MRRLPVVIIMGLAMISFSCKDATKGSKDEIEVRESVKSDEDKEKYVLNKNAVYFENSDVTAKLFEVYQMISESLVNGDLKGAKEHENMLLEVIHSGDLNEWSRVEQVVKNLSEINDLDTYRVGFFDLTKQLEVPFKEEITKGEVFMQYCPMAFNNKGAYWFASDKEIMNPYFGDEMLHCGGIKETFK